MEQFMFTVGVSKGCFLLGYMLPPALLKKCGDSLCATKIHHGHSFSTFISFSCGVHLF